MKYKRVCCYEETYCIRSIERIEDKLEAYRLRHLVFCETLQWKSPSANGLEVDQYDQWADLLGVFSKTGALLGLTRFLPASHPFMIESDFAVLVPQGYQIRKKTDTVEVSRFMVAPRWKNNGLSSMLLRALLKGLYQWSLVNEIRYLYIVVEKRFWRTLLLLGFPWTPIGPVRALPPGGVESLAALLDWEEFRPFNQRATFFSRMDHYS